MKVLDFFFFLREIHKWLFLYENFIVLLKTITYISFPDKCSQGSESPLDTFQPLTLEYI